MLSDSVVLNIGTLYAIFEAVVNDWPLIERVLTVTGSPVAVPRNLKVRLGTRIGDLFEECGGLTGSVGKVVVGGPMRGLAVDSLDTPVTKALTGVMAFTAQEARVRTEWPCINCGDCVEACPWDLVPTRLYKLIKKEDFSAAEREGLSRCTECGCCAFACPSHIPLVHVLRGGKMQNRAAMADTHQGAVRAGILLSPAPHLGQRSSTARMAWLVVVGLVVAWPGASSSSGFRR